MNTILVLDDDHAIRFLYKEELACEGYNVITTGDCHNLFELIDKEQPALIVLEAVIGRCDGMDLLQKIRKVYYDLPIILCTASSKYRNDLRSIAADYCLLKSSDLSELKQKIRMAIETTFPFNEEIISDKNLPELAELQTAGQDVGGFIAYTVNE